MVMRVIYLPEPFFSPVTPLLISEEEPTTIYLDEKLQPVKCYSQDWFPVECPKSLDFQEGEYYVVGGASAEVLASYLNLPFVDEKRVKMQEEYDSRDSLSLVKCLKLAAGKPEEEPLIKNTILAILPGSIVKKKTWGVAYVARIDGDEPEVKAEIHFDQNFRTVEERISELDEIYKFEYWWQPPWEYIFAYGKNFRRLVEIISERPVEKIPPEILRKHVHLSVEDIIRDLYLSIRRSSAESVSRRSLKKAVIYIDDNLVKPSKTYTAVLVTKNQQRKIFARWYFDEKLNLRGFDNVPPEAVTGIDAEIAVGRVPRETQASLSEAHSSFLVKKAIYSPVRIIDYLAIKVHRWYEVALI
ncbi:hypothetical protein MA03_01090 [Infirmifilum uzonense]|uniref:Uncharacterized protein n=1 Tax=Infirmifilum uzonense TaxID=1550241 RepID=A0A0F7FGD1_9CREN|nr:hypothetical protein [Infirmifilum uzonense]AKG38160.1 hypothetical protein MA03_01090 [Infirmifilum uzonense]